ncbi:MAG: carbamoyl-phosphate synthase large subunit [Chlamydiae bacterium]|nr:carbamoyl-phosphate synthase large subunit [Chlamydiota bacterium]
MPLDHSIRKVLVLGAGPIVIGQACEFDYSGTQACKSLKEEGCEVILLNSNPATIMTDPNIADSVYIEPINSEVIEKIIIKEKPDSLLPTMGGQTALNYARLVSKQGILKKYGVKLIGLKFQTIEKAENRELFKNEMQKIGVQVPLSFCVKTWDEALSAAKKIGFPSVIRCSYTLGGQGGGIAYDLRSFEQICKEGFSFSKELLIEESLIGWKEFELEVMRDRLGNCIVVCGIENVDPMGIHTGDSITVAPIQTLTDKEYQIMRKNAFKVIEAIGMTSGGCNVQFAVNPLNGKMVCIEVNPRVSRSSALASKATGFPIAKIAAKIALGYHLNELKNELTTTPFPSSFEPVIDYVVTKIPFFNFDKFPEANQQLTTYMKSIGEVMSIGRTFKESLNKAISSLCDISGYDFPREKHEIRKELKIPHPKRLGLIYKALQNEISVNEIHLLTGYDRWFLMQILELVQEEKVISKMQLGVISFEQMYRWKQMGFSDKSLAVLLKCEEKQVFEKRYELKVLPTYKRVDTCSAEFPNDTAYMYSTYEEECECNPSLKKKILVIGSGPNRIGQGIEFDYCCVHAVNAIKDLGYESIILNCNPETVSTDYDIAERLYLEPITLEHVLEVISKEKPNGVIIQFGGQTSLNIGKHLYQRGIELLGTPFVSIDLTEDRRKFRLFAQEFGINQPKNAAFTSSSEALQLAKEIGFPLILRPSYVIGGNSIQIIQNQIELEKYLEEEPLEDIGPILMEEFLEDAIEVDVDAICDGKDVFVCGIVEHIEKTGIHSGDSMSFLSPYSLTKEMQKEISRQTIKIGLSLRVVGLFNVQFAIYKDRLLVIEVNPRASRTVPLLSKTTGLPLIQIATKCILGLSLKDQKMGLEAVPKFLALKIPVFPFARLHIENIKLGPQMKSTGEVLCVGKTFDELFMKAKLYVSENRKLFRDGIEKDIPFSEEVPELKVYPINNLSLV